VRSLAILLLIVPALNAAAHAQPAATGTDTVAARPTDERVKALVAALSAEDWKERTKAQGELTKLGAIAEPHLLDRLKQNPDAETRTLIEALLKAIEEARQIGPATVTLRLDNASPRLAFASLAEQAQITFAPGADALLDSTDKRISVNLDRAPLWESLLKLSAQTGVAFNSIDSEGHIVLEALPSSGAVAAPPAAAAGPFLVTIHTSRRTSASPSRLPASARLTRGRTSSTTPRAASSSSPGASPGSNRFAGSSTPSTNASPTPATTCGRSAPTAPPW
jgi:hypothetical protein